jgi:hypothetical protein
VAASRERPSASQANGDLAGVNRVWREMHDLIYGRDQGLEPALLPRLADRLELDLDRFDSKLAGEPRRLMVPCRPR